MDYITRPIKPVKLDAVLKRDLGHIPAPIREETSNGDKKLFGPALVSASRAMQKIRRQIESVAQLDVPVLILGEHGTGRETVARLIHELSSRSKYRFEKITCEGFPEELLDSELFGHIENGNGKIPHIAKGKFEGNANGTVLLEEISRMPLGLQAKILHVVKGGEFFRKGGSSKIAIDVRIMATNHVDIEQAIRDRKLREDLFFVLGAFTIELPPLRERKEDIPLLLARYMDRLAAQHGRAPKPFSAALVEVCQDYEWPGNLRELENLVHRYLIMGNDSLTLRGLHARSNGLFPVSRQMGMQVKHMPHSPLAASGSDSPAGLKSLIRNLKGETEINAISSALEQTGWNRRKAALLLNISYRGLLYKIREYGLVAPSQSTAASQGHANSSP